MAVEWEELGCSWPAGPEPGPRAAEQAPPQLPHGGGGGAGIAESTWCRLASPSRPQDSDGSVVGVVAITSGLCSVLALGQLRLWPPLILATQAGFQVLPCHLPHPGICGALRSSFLDTTAPSWVDSKPTVAQHCKGHLDLYTPTLLPGPGAATLPRGSLPAPCDD